ncbi:hypothetical protein DXG01_002236 [Tephrocybe rancida]|nr:hypothetical protein DXG01_002236 [Tephrocybe rancida]
MQHSCDFCRKAFGTASGLNYHAHSCTATKKRVGSALENLKEVWQRKQHRLDATLPDGAAGFLPSEEDSQIGTRRSNRKPVLPKCYRDYIPQSTFPLTVPSTIPAAEPIPPTIMEGTVVEIPSLPIVSSEILFKRFASAKNIFRLSRIYHRTQLPTHDPEDSIALRDLDDIPKQNVSESSSSFISPYFPYPNKTSFSLGNWFWSHGTQKSLRSFKELVQIIGSDDFNPKDVQNTRWGAIDKLLKQSDFDEGQQQEWEDEDAGWKRTPITLDIPFHKRMQNKGTQQHLVGHIYHQLIVSVIKEKLANPQDNKRFHYEPFKLFWNPTLGQDQGHHVYGKSYTSASFVVAHRKLQESPGEPGCDLP